MWGPGTSRTVHVDRPPLVRRPDRGRRARRRTRHRDRCRRARGRRRRVVTWTDGFDGTSLDARWNVVNPDPANVSVSDGSLRIAGQPGDTYQTVNSAKNIVVLDVPVGDFTATADVSAASRRSTRAPASSPGRTWTTTSAPGSPSSAGSPRRASPIETDVETGASFSAVSFADRPASSAERLRLQRVGDTHHLELLDRDATGCTPPRPPSRFDTTQVGLYALAAQDGTVLPAAFDSFTIEHAPGADVIPEGPFVLQADGDAPLPRRGRRRARADRRAAHGQPAAAGHRPRRRRPRALHRRRPAPPERRRPRPRRGR